MKRLERLKFICLKEHAFAITFIIIALGIGLRFGGLNFDQGQQLHPDERFLRMTMEAIDWPSSFNQYFDSKISPLNPTNHRETFYVYGDLPLFLGKVLLDIGLKTSPQSPAMTLRTFSAFVDIILIVIVFLLGAQTVDYHTGLLAAALYALAVLPIQLSHFFTVDPFLNLFLSISFLFLIHYIQKPSCGKTLLAGLFWGLALASKISALIFAPVILAAGLLVIKKYGYLKTAGCLGAALFMTVISFRFFNPYAFAGPHWYNLSLNPVFLDNLATLKRISQPFSGFPPSLQWAFQTPWLFPLKSMALWGLGLPFFIAAAFGIGLFLQKIIRHRHPEATLLLFWTILNIAIIGAMPNQIIRYLLPVYPMAAIFAAFALLELRKKLSQSSRCSCWPLLLTLLLVSGWAFAFTTIYRKPMTRIRASRWIYNHIPPNSKLIVESWDDALPLALPGNNPGQYQQITINPTNQETETKKECLLNCLQKADYIVISSSRNYASITRLPKRFPLASRYYELLFGNLAGFSLVAQFSSHPELGPVKIIDEQAEEAFTVYDHPRVFIYQKDKNFSSAFLAQEFKAVKLPAAGTSTSPQSIRPPLSPITMTTLKNRQGEELIYLARWLALLIILGLAGQFISSRLFSGTGFPARSLVAAGGAYIYGLFLKYSQVKAEYIILVLGITFFWLAIKGLVENRERKDVWPSLVFWSTIILFMVFRAYNSAIVWGERPFDFSLLNAMTRAETLPPIDPWFAGSPLRYHAWGQFFIGFLGRVAHLPTALTYNLGAALVPALATELLFWAIRFYRNRFLPAMLGITVIYFSGNLSAWFFAPWKKGWCFADFWQPSRIIPGTINEFPFWSSLFADLHGHFIGLVFSAQFLAAIFLLQKSSPETKWKAGLLGGIALGWLVLSNPWSGPVYVLFLVLLLMTKTSLKEVVPGLIMLPLALLCSLPFWSGPGGIITFSTSSLHTDFTQFFIIFGPFLVTYLIWLQQISQASYPASFLFIAGCGSILYLFPLTLVAATMITLLTFFLIWRHSYNNQTIFPYLFLITGLLVIIGCDLYIMVDRMNTIFKFYFEIWILLGLGATLTINQIQVKNRESRFKTLACFLILTSGFLTSITTVRAWWSNPIVKNQKITFNGLHFLASQPGEALTLAWLDKLKGQPTIAEAAGPSYAEFSRFSAFTGLPAVIGWQYHVFQHGHSLREIAKRRQDIKLLYQQTSHIRKIIERYDIEYGIIGEREKKCYGNNAGRGWRKAGWRPIFRSGGYEIWGNPKL